MNRTSLLLLFVFAALAPAHSQANKNDVFKDNAFIQDALKKYSGSYEGDFDGYAKDRLYGIPKTKGSVYAVSAKNADDLVRLLLTKADRYYAFKVEQTFGLRNAKDKVAVVRGIKDQFELLKLMGIQGNDFTISNDRIVKWFRQWKAEFDFRIIGVGLDFIQADILKEPRDYLKLAREIYSMCPDVVDQGTESVGELAAEMKRSKTMFFWWD